MFWRKRERKSFICRDYTLFQRWCRFKTCRPLSRLLQISQIVEVNCRDTDWSNCDVKWILLVKQWRFSVTSVASGDDVPSPLILIGVCILLQKMLLQTSNLLLSRLKNEPRKITLLQNHPQTSFLTYRSYPRSSTFNSLKFPGTLLCSPTSRGPRCASQHLAPIKIQTPIMCSKQKYGIRYAFYS